MSRLTLDAQQIRKLEVDELTSQDKLRLRETEMEEGALSIPLPFATNAAAETARTTAPVLRVGQRVRISQDANNDNKPAIYVTTATGFDLDYVDADAAQVAAVDAKVDANALPVADETALEALTYSDVSEGRNILQLDKSYTFRVAASGEANPDRTTTGGIKLFVTGETVDIKAYGAPFDGVTESASFLNKAVQGSAKKILITDGDFLIGTTASDYIQLGAAASGKIIQGAGGTVKLADNTPLSSSLSAFEVDGATDLIIQNVFYDGNNRNNTGNTGSSTGLVGFCNVRRSENVIISNNIVKDSNNGGIYATDGSQRVTGTGNIFIDCFGSEMRVGLPDGATLSQATFIGNQCIVTRNIHAGVQKQDGCFASRWGGDSIFALNRIYIDPSVTDVPSSLIWIVQARKCIIEGNEVSGVDPGTYAIQANVTDDVEQLIIRGNNFAAGQGIFISDSGGPRTIDEIIIDANRIFASSQGGIIVAPTASLTVGRTLITANIVDWGGGQGIDVNVTDGVVASNVLRRSGGSHGIFASGSDLVIDANQIDMNSGTGRGIELYCTDSVVTSNRTKNAAGFSIREQGTADWNLITNNHGKGAAASVSGANTVASGNI